MSRSIQLESEENLYTCEGCAGEGLQEPLEPNMIQPELLYKLRRIWSTCILVLITSVFVLYSSFRYTVSPSPSNPPRLEREKRSR